MLAAAVAMALLCVARQTSPATTHTNFPSFFPPFIAPCSPEYEGGGGAERRRNGGRSHFRVSQGLLLLFFTLPLLLPERERDLRRIWKFLFPVAQYVTATCVRYKSSFFYVCICSTFVSLSVHTYVHVWPFVSPPHLCSCSIDTILRSCRCTFTGGGLGSLGGRKCVWEVVLSRKIFFSDFIHYWILT